MIRFNDHWIANRNQLANKMKLILGSTIVLFSIFHVLIVTSMVSENSDNSAIVFATNNDASVAITVATQTRWFNDNGWRPYGPLYYRLAHSLSGMVPYYKAQSAIPQEANQVNHHFSLMLVSLVSLLLTCFFIAGLFGLEGAEKIGLASLFLSLFLLNRTFSRYVLVAHPDFLLTFFTSLLFVSAYRFLKNPTNLALTFIGVTFGLMLSTKITAILFFARDFLDPFPLKEVEGEPEKLLEFWAGFHRHLLCGGISPKLQNSRNSGVFKNAIPTLQNCGRDVHWRMDLPVCPSIMDAFGSLIDSLCLLWKTTGFRWIGRKEIRLFGQDKIIPFWFFPSALTREPTIQHAS